MVGRISEMLQVQVTHDTHIKSVVRIMLAHVVVPSFDDQDVVTLRTLGSHSMCIQLLSPHMCRSCLVVARAMVS